MKIKAKCLRCDHKWFYTGKKLKLLKKVKSIHVNCPNCHTSVTIKFPGKEVKKKVK